MERREEEGPTKDKPVKINISRMISRGLENVTDTYIQPKEMKEIKEGVLLRSGMMYAVLWKRGREMDLLVQQR